MYCTKCGVELKEGDHFCSHCGTRTAAGQAAFVSQPPASRPLSHTLALDKRHSKIAGVCAGFARYLEVDVILVRVIWLSFALITGIGFLVYFAAWIIMPTDARASAQAAWA